MQTLLLQSSQSINWLAVLGPSIISGLFVIVVQIILALWLSKVTEGHRADLSKDVAKYQQGITKEVAKYQQGITEELADYQKGISEELETYRNKLQSGFYQFQTKYSLLHQKRAEAIEKLFGLLAKVENNIMMLATWEGLSRSGNKAEFYAKTLEDFQNLIEFNLQKRIYFDKEIADQVIQLLQTLSPLLTGKDKECLISSEPGFGPKKAAAATSIKNITRPLMVRLEETFKALLSAEAPTHQAASPS